MGKLFVRMTTITVAIYLLICYLFAQIVAVDIMNDWYAPLFELIVVIYSFSEGRYHCKYMRFLALAIFVSDTITRIDNSLSVFSTSAHNLIPILFLSLAILYGTTMSLVHFARVMKHKNKQKIYATKPN
jgi:hypothetical protein